MKLLINYSHAVNALGNELTCFDLPVHWFDETGSTNDEAKKFISQQEVRKSVLFATAFQSEGRGQREKKWLAPRGTCILTSLIIPSFWAAWNPMLLKWTGALAISETCSDFGLQNITIKSPNDVLVNGRKISGILLENSYSKGNLISSVLGVGINVSFNALTGAEDFPIQPTSFTLENVCMSLSEVYCVWVKKMDTLLSEFQKRSVCLVDRIEPWIPKEDRETFLKEIQRV